MPRLPLIAATLTSALLTVFPSTSAAEQPPAEEPRAEAPATEAQRIAELVRQLGDKDFRTREAAEQQLAKVGFAADAALRAAVKRSNDAEIVARAKRLLSKLADKRAGIRKNVQAEQFAEEKARFIEDGTLPKSGRLPGWKSLRALLGESSPVTRKLYVDMYEGETALLDAMSATQDALLRRKDIARTREKYLSIERERWGKLRQEVRVRKAKLLKKKQPTDLTESEEARLFAFYFADTQVPREWTGKRFGVHAFGTFFGIAGPQATNWGRPSPYRRFKEDSPRVRALKKIFEVWAFYPTDVEARRSTLQAAMNVAQEDIAVDLAEGLLKEKEKLDKDTAFLAVHALFLWGETDRHVKLLTPLLDDEREKRFGGWRGGDPPRKFLLLREFALWALARLKDEPVKEYSPSTSVVVYCPVKRWVKIFLWTKDDAWQQARKKWEK